MQRGDSLMSRVDAKQNPWNNFNRKDQLNCILSKNQRLTTEYDSPLNDSQKDGIVYTKNEATMIAKLQQQPQKKKKQTK